VRSGISSGKKPKADERSWLSKSFPPAFLRPSALAFFICLCLPLIARADSLFPALASAGSVSGQFVITAAPGISPLQFIPDLPTNEDLVRLDPAVLAVSADRVRDALLKKLGMNPSAPWSGKIFLALHPARALDENVEIASTRFGDGWTYNVLLPDLVPRTRLARALTGVLLLEFANRYSGTNHSAELPPWLVDGLSQELLADDMQGLIVSAPGQDINGFPFSSTSLTRHGMDSLIGARAVFQNYSILTFSELSWPTEAQVYGDDGGAYRASAQLFVDKLLALPNGSAKLRTMVALLPRYYNWQTAFWSAFHEDFSSALQVEKWWALQSVVFASGSPGPQWSLSVSREKLDEILSVSVEFRAASNSLPADTEISLQTVIRNLPPDRQTEILETKLRDLEIAQFRMARSLAVLTAQYRNVLAGYLGQPLPARGQRQLHKDDPIKISEPDTLRILNALDARRRATIVATLPRELE
jgi:hypothetical protein